MRTAHENGEHENMLQAMQKDNVANYQLSVALITGNGGLSAYTTTQSYSTDMTSIGDKQNS